MAHNPSLEFHSLTPGRWQDFERLFGPRGACGGCWCMYWKRTRKEFEANQGDGNRRAQEQYVASGCIPGLLARLEGIPVGWIAIEPRRQYPGLERSRILKPVDSEPVWSVTCFFVSKAHRRRGLTVALLRAAVDYAAQQGGSIVEGYPIEPRKGSLPPPFVYTGLVSAFLQSGFVEVARRSETRPIMRRYIG